MITFIGDNVNEVYYNAMMELRNNPDAAVRQESRNGPVVEFVAPVTSVYYKPCERVLFDPIRDCNPFLHFFESLWMLAGRNDLAFLDQFTTNFRNFSDNGKFLNGAYGHRWRYHFGYDQLDEAISMLTQDPNSRRVVTQMWDAAAGFDLGSESKDIPCNTAVFWRLRNGVLDMTVTNRSNDILWGAYGANAVHFSFLHEYVAASLGVKVGTYYQMSNSLHMYTEFPVSKRVVDGPQNLYNPYDSGFEPYPLFEGGVTKLQWDSDLRYFFACYALDEMPEADTWLTPFFANVVDPMWRAFVHRRDGQFRSHWEDIVAADWSLAVHEWAERRNK